MGTGTGGGTPGLVDALRWLPRGFRSAGAHRAGWGIVDQGFSSLTNFAVTAAVARQVGPAAFGAFSVALAVYICVLWVARSMVGEPFVVRLTGSPVPRQTDATHEAVGAAVLTGTVAGVATVALGLVAGGATGSALVVMGVFLPALLAQDAYRYVLMARGRARSAAANDALWLAVQTVVTAGLFATGQATVTGLTAAFGAGAAAGAGYGAWQSGALPTLARSRRWLRSHADLWVPFVLELLTVNATPQFSMLAVAAAGEVVTVGALRAGLFLFAPLSVLFSGLFLVSLPEAVRLRSRSPAGLRIFVVALAAAMGALTLAWAGGLSLIPSNLGRALLKSNWATGHRLVWPMAAFTVACTTIMAAMVGLRALEASRKSIRARIWAGPIVVASGIVGAELGGAPGATIGLALSSFFSAGLAWLVLWRTLANATGRPARPAPSGLIEGQPPLVAEWA